ncbi:MAG: high frequency lysogenization protein HflD [Gammaproteobacteria bacterium]|nr:high frequency lysogenization protein HflD [Gammaproteobacteria bacterium]NIR32843.1 high frequency lysogenization protein HflD [Gammaproteobacteria bacterium]NIR99390.1 high frequency lysogenization protein HflD [Gammaproteobacteria bacterium]NIT65004.1 high frequency lysogenization protein HflD [Gammaproteobacteria bacterium]NIV21918.1 high frequency lysogenization protein HflD [Gammaproteobacteria bacterium]
MSRSLQDRALALAGVFQAACLVRDTAHRGKEITPAVRASIHSIFKIDADDVANVFGGVPGLRTGLQSLAAQLGDGIRRDAELTRYAVALLYLERKLARRAALLERVRDGICAARDQADYFSETHGNVIARLADIYQQTVSTLTPRIMVSGESSVLSNPDNAAMIRTLLLAGIRSAVLWRQCGGSRLQLLLQRGRLVREAAELLRQYPGEPETAPGDDTLH